MSECPWIAAALVVRGGVGRPAKVRDTPSAGPLADVGEEVPPPRGRKLAGAAPVRGLAVPAEAAVSAPAAVAPAAAVS
ncbi:short chain dehydrogenase, partial [Mycobacteroides abscessus]|nr:short chain dehydrogenase [Mycobacteroides abscessus]